jgi:hypothetical protein
MLTEKNLDSRVRHFVDRPKDEMSIFFTLDGILMGLYRAKKIG